METTTHSSTKSRVIISKDFEHLRRRVRSLTGLDLGAYKQQQMQRRLRSFCERNRLENFVALAKSLEDPEKLEEFKVYVTINVSEFFRNPQRFRELQTDVLPELPSGALKIWSAGCANGAEPYSLAMLMRHARPGPGHVILATDIDAPSLDRAQKGVYGASDIKSVPQEILDKGFAVVGDQYTVRPTMRRMVTFQRHDLLHDTYPQGMDVIVCRNVVIYFSDEARNRIFRGFRKALRPGGFLFVGSTETLFSPERFGFKQYRPFFYRAI